MDHFLWKFTKLMLTAGLLFMTAVYVYVTVFPYDDAITNISSITGISRDLFVYEDPKDKGVEVFSYIYHNSYRIFALGALISAFLGTFFFYKGRTLLEAMALFIFLFIPRQRKTWGRLFDAKSEKGIPLATIRLYKVLSDGTKSLASQVPTDFEGHFKITIPDVKAKYQIVATAGGYDENSFEFAGEKTAMIGQDFLDDIAMMPKGASSNKDNFFGFISFTRVNFFEYLLVYIYIFSIVNFLRSFYGIFIYPQIISYFLAFAHGLAILWNTFVVFERFRHKTGRVIDVSTNQVVKNLSLQFFHNMNLLGVSTSSSIGIVHTSLPKGKYKVKLASDVYQFNDNGSFFEVEVDSYGYLSDDLRLKPKVVIDSNHLENNPFA